MKPSRKRRTSTETDWTAVRERLARAQAATASAVELPEDRIRALMDERARALARSPEATEPPGTLAVMTFSFGTERYAMEPQYVQEVVRLREFSPVPGAPEFVLGVTNLRGEVLCLVDLRRFFDVPSTVPPLTDRSRVVVVGTERVEFGILVDEAFEISRLHPKDIASPPESVSGVGRKYVLGVTREALILLDGAALLRDPRLYVNQDRSSLEA